MKTIDELKGFHAKVIEPRLGPAIGASEEEVAALEGSLGHDLPRAYRDFLLFMGKDRNGIFRGSDCFIEQILDNNEALPELLAENQLSFELPSRFVCFFMHQGYIAAWFALPATNDDPVCWLFNEGTTPRPETGKTVLELIGDDMQGLSGELA